MAPTADDEPNHFKKIMTRNQEWAKAKKKKDPEFFERLSKQQHPDYLWIGCADSRVPANQIMGLDPGEVFVHRNIANQFNHTDLNALAVLQYAVEYLKVKHIIVCGHYGCGGVAAAYDHQYLGLIDHWLGPIKDVYHDNKKEVDALPGKEARLDRLCEMNVEVQIARVASTPIVQKAWERGQELTINGFIYSLKDGILKMLDVHCNKPEEVGAEYRFNTVVPKFMATAKATSSQ